jgi:alpha-beta hydrolase superfamily lysophospholipase
MVMAVAGGVASERQLQEIISVDGLRLEAAVHLAAGSPGGTVVLAHGVTVDMDEGGMFVRLADGIAASGLTAVRFSFRGHGRSGGTQEGVTIAGEMLDLQAVLGQAERAYPGPLFIVAASFGAVSTLLSLPYLEDHLAGLVLWNPVFDLVRTFLAPELPWGLENFGAAARRQLGKEGYLTVDGEFRLGRVLFEELGRYDPVSQFLASERPALVIHGDRDTYVSYDVAREASAVRGNCQFHPIIGSDHGFDSREREDKAISVTLGWLSDLATKRRNA